MKPLRWFVLSSLGVALLALCGCSGGSTATGEGNHYGKYTLHSTKYDNVDMAKAKANVDDVLTQLQGQDNLCMIGLWAYNPPAILSAVKAIKQEGKIHIIGFDENEITLQGVKDGSIHATVVQQPFEFGYQSIKALYTLARDPNAPAPPQVKNGLWPIDHKVIRKNDVDGFVARLAEQKAEAARPASPPGENAVKVAFITNNSAEFWTIAEAGARAAAAEINKNNPRAGVEMLFRRPKNGTAAEQKEIVDDLVNQGVKAIGISVNDAKNQRDFINQVAEKIPVVCVDNDAPDTKRRFYLGTDNIQAGMEVGKLVKEVLPNGGTIAIFVGKPDAPNAQERRQGVLDELAGAKNAQGK